MISTLGDLNGIAQSRYSFAAVSSVSSAAGKLYVPVAPALVGYSQFKHVAGVAAGKGQSGVNISKISILNALIERLAGIKKGSAPAADTSQLTDIQIDNLIRDYQSRIQNIVGIAKSNPYVLGGAPANKTAVLFSISA